MPATKIYLFTKYSKKVASIRIKIVEKKVKCESMKYAEFITSLSILKGTVNIEFNVNSYWLEKSEMRVLPLHFKIEIQLEHTTSF